MNDIGTCELFWGPDMGSMVVQAVLEELQLPYTMTQVNFGAMEHKTAEFALLNPLSKVPALRLPDGTVMTESAAMVIYLCDLHPESGLLPDPANPSRAIALRWLMFLATDVYSAAYRVYRPDFVTIDVAETKGIAQQARDEFDTCCRIIEEDILLPGPYILGDTFSAVDLYLAMVLQWHHDRDGIRARQANVKQFEDVIFQRQSLITAFTKHQTASFS